MRLLTIQTQEFFNNILNGEGVDPTPVHFTQYASDDDYIVIAGEYFKPVYAYARIGSYKTGPCINVEDLHSAWCQILAHTYGRDNVMIYMDVPEQHITCIKKGALKKIDFSVEAVQNPVESYESVVVATTKVKKEWILSAYTGPIGRHYNTMQLDCVYDSGNAPLLINKTCYFAGDGYIRRNLDCVGDLTPKERSILLDELKGEKVLGDTRLLELKYLLRNDVIAPLRDVLIVAYEKGMTTIQEVVDNETDTVTKDKLMQIIFNKEN